MESSLKRATTFRSQLEQRSSLFAKVFRHRVSILAVSLCASTIYYDYSLTQKGKALKLSKDIPAAAAAAVAPNNNAQKP